MIPKVFGFSKEKRLLTSAEYRAVFTEPMPIKSSSSYLTVLARPNEQAGAKLGVVVAKRNVRLAVRRNLMKRLIRESFRLHQDKLCGLDLVVLVRRDFKNEHKPNTFFVQNLEKLWRTVVTTWKNG